MLIAIFVLRSEASKDPKIGTYGKIRKLEKVNQPKPRVLKRPRFTLAANMILQSLVPMASIG